MIPNPNPIVASFDGMWIISARIVMPAGKVDAKLQAYDSQTKHLLSTEGTMVRGKVLPIKLLNEITSNIKRVAGNNSDIRVVDVIAPNPNANVCVSTMFAAGRPHIIRDAYELAQTDEAFASVLAKTIQFIAS